MNEPAAAGAAPYRPKLLYSVTGRLNVAVWRLPLPHRVLARLSMLVYRNPPMEGDRVVEIVEALRDAGVDCWVSGGWGVDALAGCQTRLHRDLDLVVEASLLERAAEVLGTLGFQEWYRADSERPLFTRLVLRDHPVAGRAVDLHPLDVETGHVEFVTGSIEGRPMPCLSVESQVKTHSNYRKRWRDRADLATLRKALEGSTTALVVPVQVADELREDSAREAGMPAHVTVLHPFLRSRKLDAQAERALSETVERLPPFDFALAELGSFPKVVYLAPQPAEPFVALTEAIVARWPEHKPYGGAFEQIVPHVTIAYADEPPGGLAERLPIQARAEEVWLMSKVAGHWTRRRRFPLRGVREGG